MRPAYRIDLEHGCIFVKWSGVVTAHDIVAFNLELARDPEYRSGLNRLVDLRGANFEASSDEIEEMATETIKSRDTIEGRRKGAMLVGRDFDFGLMRIFDVKSDLTQTKVRPFRDRDEAAAWLGLPETLGDPFE